MAVFMYRAFVKMQPNTVFDQDHEPGDIAPHAGIYRCMGCGREILSTFSIPLPSEHHHPHDACHGQRRWRLIVFAEMMLD